MPGQDVARRQHHPPGHVLQRHVQPRREQLDAVAVRRRRRIHQSHPRRALPLRGGRHMKQIRVALAHHRYAFAVHEGVEQLRPGREPHPQRAFFHHLHL